MYKDLYCSITLIANKQKRREEGKAVNRIMFQLSTVLCRHLGKLVGKDIADADDGPLVSPEPASLFLAAGLLAFSKSSELPGNLPGRSPSGSCG